MSKAKRYVQHTTDSSPQFKKFRNSGQINDPDLCLYCGDLLRPYHQGGKGHRGDNAFCSLRCGYSYGVLTAKATYNPAR